MYLDAEALAEAPYRKQENSSENTNSQQQPASSSASHQPGAGSASSIPSPPRYGSNGVPSSSVSTSHKTYKDHGNDGRLTPPPASMGYRYSESRSRPTRLSDERERPRRSSHNSLSPISRRTRSPSRSPSPGASRRYRSPRSLRDNSPRSRRRYSRSDRSYRRHEESPQSPPRYSSRRSRYRDDHRSRRRGVEDDFERRSRRRDHSRGRSRGRDPSPINEDDLDRRTVFVSQLANRLTTRELSDFFEQAGPVRDAQIVRDKVSGRSKGVAYVEFRDEDSVQHALSLSGKRLLGIPVIVQLTEAEKNRKAREAADDEDVKAIFDPFGEIELVRLQRDEQNRSKGFGYIQYRDPMCARNALEKMNGFDLAGRSMRVCLGNDKFTTETTSSMLKRFDDMLNRTERSHYRQGRTRQTSVSASRDLSPEAEPLSPSEQEGRPISRDELMKKLARIDDASPVPTMDVHPDPTRYRSVILKNMFDPKEETSATWVEELEQDVREECENKYGRVMHITVVPSEAGEIFVKFKTFEECEKAVLGLHQRWFGGRKIIASKISEADYNIRFPDAKHV
ncbi:RNA-binding protein Rsd1 [Schizosaccharomyces cryophilus OY26]|uniref:RNA-binding protein Rsd1 n=1 Tax=Schizosaccharomyces cryophilus (strain OY26 / ATCC MYA-4695 / CBS 11777 / NBRC 106824 / NRRL Y48691) TaxID=653667 RepID=S9XCB0_SCHCR|nr:RNA-binding protein Rsd1 [Schizosaccharomyces cryophilus OY26]EPY51466.1 RNA-binding protein Rsd1 [Schizosaccharomyces cryophilus OY26]